MYLRRLILEVFAHARWEHWVIIGLLSLALTGWVLIRTRSSVYGGDLFGGDGFYGPVPAGYGSADPDRGRGGAQDGI